MGVSVEFSRFASLVGAVQANDPQSYSVHVWKRLRFLVQQFLYMLSEAEKREAIGVQFGLQRGDALALALAVRVMLRPEDRKSVV